MNTPQVYFNIDEKIVSLTVFLTRLLAGLTLLYISVGCLLFYREFLFNAAVLGVPTGVAIGSVVVLLFAALFLLLGWLTRWAAAVCLVGTGVMGFVFFASNFNKVYIALVLLLMAALLPALLIGPGKISLDFTHARRRVEKEFRG